MTYPDKRSLGHGYNSVQPKWGYYLITSDITYEFHYNGRIESRWGPKSAGIYTKTRATKYLYLMSRG